MELRNVTRLLDQAQHLFRAHCPLLAGLSRLRFDAQV
jgi:hypothetical protein